MKDYTKTYLEFFGYSEADFIPCECCGAKSVDVHHIYARSIKKKLENDICNIMAVCRSCHDKFGDKKQHRDYLQNKHNEKINERR